MKNHALISILLVILVFTFGCKKDKDETTGSTASFSAKVEGTMWPAAIIMATHFTNGNLTTITAAGSVPSDQISLDIKGSGTGTFIMNDNNMGSVTIGNSSFTSMFSSNPAGQVVITKYDVENKLISGTFYFTGEDINGKVYHVTEGKFENVMLTVF
jgi:hypothetical protein